ESSAPGKRVGGICGGPGLAAERPEDPGAGCILCQLRQLARRRLGRMPAAGEQNRLARPIGGLAGDVRNVPANRALESLLARSRDAAVAERVRITISARGVDDDFGVLDALGSRGVPNQQSERPRGAGGRRNLLVLEQPLATHRDDAGAELQVRRDRRQRGERLEQTLYELGAGQAL